MFDTTEDIDPILVPPHVKEAIADYKFFEGFKKAFGVDDKPPIDTLDPDSDDDVSLDQFMAATAAVGELQGDQTPTEALIHSHACGLHLAKCKLAMAAGHGAEAHQSLNKAMQHFVQVHGALHRAAETDLHSRAGE